MICELCQKEFQPFKVPFNGHEIDSQHCPECREKKKAEVGKYKKQNAPPKKAP